MYILVMLWDDLNADVFMGMEWFNTLKDAVDAGRNSCKEIGDHFQIWKQTAGRSEMDIIPEEEYNNDKN